MTCRAQVSTSCGLHWLLADFRSRSVAISFLWGALREQACWRWNIFSNTPGAAGVVRGGKNLAGNLAIRDQELLDGNRLRMASCVPRFLFSTMFVRPCPLAL